MKTLFPMTCSKCLHILIITSLLISGCGGGGTATTPVNSELKPITEPDNSPIPSGETGVLSIDITDILGKFMESRIQLTSKNDHKVISLYVPKGQKDFDIEEGDYTANIAVYDEGVPYVVSTKQIRIARNKATYLLYELLEGAGAGRSLGDFDQDGDLVLGRVEMAENTDPFDATSVPGIETLNWPPQKLSSEAGWLRGELHAHSNYGVGTEKVKDVIRRAEKLELDFLAIMDRNTLAPSLDPDFHSESLVLIPGMEWGDDANGVALVYGPRSLPTLPTSSAEMGAGIRFIQAQGGLVFAAHPCYPIGSWNWNVNNLNGIQAWCMGWRDVPSITLEQVHESNRQQASRRIQNPTDDAVRVAIDGRYTHPLAKAANLPGLSSNGQSTTYWDYELNRGLRLGVISGSQTGSPKVNMAEPVTYVYAKEKSLQGILDGLRFGRTYISRGLDGPKIEWVGDIFGDKSIDVNIGGIVPLDEETQYYCRIRNAKGKKLEIMVNGSPVISQMIVKDEWVFTYTRKPDAPVAYRIRIVAPPTEKGYGIVDTLAMTGPIYAQGVIPDEALGGSLVAIENEYVDPSEINSFIKYLEKNSTDIHKSGQN